MANKQQIIEWLEQNNIKNYTLVPDQKYGYVINVEGDVNLSAKNLTSIPYKFGKITGIFDCSFNYLTSLENSPDEVKSFDCSYNRKLHSLKGGPKIVHEEYRCYKCDLYTLQGAPFNVNYFYCYDNPKLTSLEHGPKIVTKEYNCSNCNLLTLKGVPIKVDYFFCCDNKNLTSLNYAPQYTKKFTCSYTNITHLPAGLSVQIAFIATGSSIKNLLGCPQNCKQYWFNNCSLISLDGLPKHGNYKICLENSLDMIPIDNIIKNLMKLQKPIVLVYFLNESYYNNILSQLLPEVKQKIKDIIHL